LLITVPSNLSKNLNSAAHRFHIFIDKLNPEPGTMQKANEKYNWTEDGC